MHVYLTGATGFVGSYILQELIHQGHTVRCLLRDPAARLDEEGESVERTKGDVTDPKSLKDSMRGCDAVIHLVGLLEENPRRGLTFQAVHDEGTRNVVNEAARTGVETFIHMSANGATSRGRSNYQRTKWAAEQHVQNAAFKHWVIFRPSLMFGKPRPDQIEFSTQLIQQLIRPFPVLPLFGDGTYELQPISVRDVARAFVQALERPGTAGKIYCAGGPDRIQYRKALDIMAEGAGIRSRPKIPQPMWLIRPIVRAAGKPGPLPISTDQLEMLVNGNTCDARQFEADFDLVREPYTSKNLEYLRQV